MIVDVDYLSRMNDTLVKQHTLLANAWSIADRTARPRAYESKTLETLLHRGKYSIKYLPAQGAQVHTCEPVLDSPLKNVN